MILIKLPRDQKEELIRGIQGYFEKEGLEAIGNLQAESLLDFFLQEAGPYVYNRAVEDARKIVLERIQAVEDDLYTLQRPVHR